MPSKNPNMYVFLMPKGELVELDQKFLQKRVTALCEELNLRFHIPPDGQILLTSGGTELIASDMPSVCGAGEDRTNPIYVFLRNDAEGPLHLQPDRRQFDGVDLLSSIPNLLRNPGAATLRELSHKMLLLSQRGVEACDAIEKMISEQRHMCEGWFIALANLAHVVDKTQVRLDNYYKTYNQFCIDAVHWEKNLKSFSKIKQELSAIPLLPQLSDATSDAIGNPSMAGSVPMLVAPRTLYDWICLHCLHTSSNLNLRTSVTGGGGLFREGSDLCLNNLRPCTPMGSQSSLSHLPVPSTVHFSTSPDPATTAASVLESGLVDIVQRALDNLDYLQAGMMSKRAIQLSASLEEDISTSSNSESTPENGMQLSYMSSQLEALRELLAAAPRDQSQHHDEDEQVGDESAIQQQRGPMGAFTGAASSLELHASPAWPIPEFEGKAASCVSSTGIAASGILESGFSRHDFSRSLALLDPMLQKACVLRDDINAITERLLNDWKQRSVSSSRGSRDRNPRALLKEQESLVKNVLERFEKLRIIFGDTMEKKLELAASLAAQQGNLQKFHSEINLKDSNIQRCRRFMERVTTVGVLLEQMKEAPRLYVKCLLEVVRRRKVDEAVAKRHDAFIERSNEFRREEIRRRRQFAKELQCKLLGEMFGPLKEAKMTTRGMDSLARRSRIPRLGSRPGRVSLTYAPAVSVLPWEPASIGDSGRLATITAASAVPASADGDQALRFSTCGRSHSTSHLESPACLPSVEAVGAAVVGGNIKPIPSHSTATVPGAVETSPLSGFRLQHAIAAAGGGAGGVSGIYRCCGGSGRVSSRGTILSVDEEDFQPNSTQLTRSCDLPSISADDLAALAESLSPELADLIAAEVGSGFGAGGGGGGMRSKKQSLVDQQELLLRRMHGALDSSLEFPFDRDEEDEVAGAVERKGSRVTAVGYSSRCPSHASTQLSVVRQVSVGTATEDLAVELADFRDRFSGVSERSPSPVAGNVESAIFSPVPSSEPITPPEEMETCSGDGLLPNASANDIFLSMDGSALQSCLGLYEGRADSQANAYTAASGDHLAGSFHSANSPTPSEASLVAKCTPAHLLPKALVSQSECIRLLCDQLHRLLPDVDPSSPPSFTGSEDPGAYLALSVQSLQSLIDRLLPLSPLKPLQISTADASLSTSSLLAAASADAVVQTTQAKCHVASECTSSDIVETGAEASEMTAEETRLVPPASSTPSDRQPLPIGSSTPTAGATVSVAPFLPRLEFTFSSFHANDLVIFVPVPSPPPKAPTPVAAHAETGAAGGEEALAASPSENASLFFRSCLGPSSSALLSSAILSSAFATETSCSSSTMPRSSASKPNAPEQWRMLSTDGHVYFLHDADFEAFGLDRVPYIPALQGARDTASARAGGHQRPPSLIDSTIGIGAGSSEARLPFSQRAVPHVAGVFLRKERCISRKDDNRFQLQRDFVFFRVHARPLTAAENEQLRALHAGAHTPRS